MKVNDFDKLEVGNFIIKEGSTKNFIVVSELKDNGLTKYYEVYSDARREGAIISVEDIGYAAVNRRFVNPDMQISLWCGREKGSEIHSYYGFIYGEKVGLIISPEHRTLKEVFGFLHNALLKKS